MTGFVTRDATHLGVDRIATSVTAFALYQNLFALAEGAPGAPKIVEAALNRRPPVLLASGSVSAAATLDVVLTAYTAYRALTFLLTKIVPATSNTAIWARVSTNGGSTYESGVNYGSGGISIAEAGGTTGFGSASDTKIICSGATIANALINGAELELTLLDQADTARRPRVFFRGVYLDQAANASVGFVGHGAFKTAQDTDAIRFLMSSGNLSANYAVFGHP